MARFDQLYLHPRARKRLHQGVDALPAAPWWRDAVGYEIYLRSFNDSDADGIGDLRGVAARLDHLERLGANLVWITPFYPSPMADYGYDVADYCGVDPLFGTLADVDHLVAEAHARGLRLLIDLVPNHCSSAHRWFRAAVGDPTGPYRDFFHWREPAPDGGPPNNWVGYFGGSAWTLDEASGQYYLHLFLPDQPDLNWGNPAVAAAFDDILRFWLDRGVDGFRIDVAQALAKDPDLRDNPQVAPWDPTAERWAQWDAFDHAHDILQPGLRDIYGRWREIADAYDAVLFGETYVTDPEDFADLLPGDGLHAGFWFQPMHIEWNAKAIRDALATPLRFVSPDVSVGWVASSHDEIRPPTRFGGGERGRNRSLAFTTLLFGLPGIPFLYQGEELGLVEGVVPEDLRQDPVGADVTLSRDGCRTPMPWADGPNFGFSDAAATWLPDGGRTVADTAEAQTGQPGSWFERYRELIAVRRNNVARGTDAVVWDDTSDHLVSYRRGPMAVVANAGERPQPIGVTGTVLFATMTDRQVGAPVGPASLIRPDEAIIVTLAG